MICGGALESPFHVGIATNDVDGVMATLAIVLGLAWVALPRPAIQHYTPHGPIRPSRRVEYSMQGPLHVELLQAEVGTIYDPTRGTHLHHVGYWTDDFAAALAAAESQGWTLEVSMRDETGRPSTFAYITRPGDLRVELVDAARRAALEALLRSGLTGEAGGGD